MIEALATAKAPPWSARLLGWQMRRFAALKLMLTPIDAAALTSRFEAELERLDRLRTDDKPFSYSTPSKS